MTWVMPPPVAMLVSMLVEVISVRGWSPQPADMPAINTHKVNLKAFFMRIAPLAMGARKLLIARSSFFAERTE
jgi:hypothetical protein